MADIPAWLPSLIGGGAVGALITAGFQHFRSGMKRIPLIERVNRLVSPELTGFALSRVVERDGQKIVEFVETAREYQLTLKNTSRVHLHDAEILFEFPSKVVEGQAERPLHSKTLPVEVKQEKISPPWQSASRWRIPELPPSDSIEFTFRAIEPTSDKYMAALYNGGNVVIQRAAGEATVDKGHILWFAVSIGVFVAGAVALLWTMNASTHRLIYSTVTTETAVNRRDCNLLFQTSITPEEPKGFFWRHSPWDVNSTVTNTGIDACYISWSENSIDLMLIPPSITARLIGGSSPARLRVSSGVWDNRPTREGVQFWFGKTNPPSEIDRAILWVKPATGEDNVSE